MNTRKFIRFRACLDIELSIIDNVLTDITAKKPSRITVNDVYDNYRTIIALNRNKELYDDDIFQETLIKVAIVVKEYSQNFDTITEYERQNFIYSLLSASTVVKEMRSEIGKFTTERLYEAKLS